MPRIGITGHTNLTSATTSLVAAGVRAALETYTRATTDGTSTTTPTTTPATTPATTPVLTGVTCLAKGADQLFAHLVLELGGAVEVVLPSADYRDRKVTKDNAAEFDELLGRADLVHTMDFDRAGREAYLAASEYLLSTVDALIAVWDGAPAGGYGGTADVVAAATRHGLPVTVVWPAGAQRE